ncbi:MAG: hypothetical protein P8M10_07365, partial [Ilumatobacter sp.]|nr:hypothetical protein [Ilumatobacter sp.]
MSNRSLALAVVVIGLIACSCSSGPGDGSSSPDAGASTIDESVTFEESGDDNSVDDPVEEAAPDTAAPAETDPDDTTGESESDSSGEFGPADFQSLGPAAGDPIVIGMVNTEGTPGLDFPEMRTDTDLAVTYLNEHGGMGGRPVQIEHCAAAGSP